MRLRHAGVPFVMVMVMVMGLVLAACGPVGAVRGPGAHRALVIDLDDVSPPEGLPAAPAVRDSAELVLLPPTTDALEVTAPDGGTLQVVNQLSIVKGPLKSMLGRHFASVRMGQADAQATAQAGFAIDEISVHRVVMDGAARWQVTMKASLELKNGDRVHEAMAVGIRDCLPTLEAARWALVGAADDVIASLDAQVAAHSP
jgi:hypothetical protein